MKIIKRVFVTALFLGFAIITISQTGHPASAVTPVTSAVTPTPTGAPVTSAATPTPTSVPTATPTLTPSISSNNNSNNNSSNSGGSSNSHHNSNNGSQTCSAEKPRTPWITSSRLVGKGAILITWSKIQENTTYYLITYSRKVGVTEYATGNINSSANSFTIRGLTGKGPFYFRVRAGNGCKPGDFSNEVVVSAAGKILYVNVPKQTKPAVLGTSNKKNIKVTTKPAAKKPVSKPTSWVNKLVFGK